MEYYTSVISLAILCLGAFIAFLQYRLYKFQIKKELYERRIPIYKHVCGYIAKIITSGTAKQEDFYQLLRDTTEVEFLFGNEIKEYIDELYSHGVKLNHYRTLMQAYIEHEDRDVDYKKACDGDHKEIKWFSIQFTEANRLFKKYLIINKHLS
jgi:DNA-binding transcriptional regulator YhcF (GntR family)